MAEVSAAWALPLLRCPTQQPQTQCVPISGVPAMVPCASATKSATPTVDPTPKSAGPAMAPRATYLPSRIPSNACASQPEVRAQCGSSARWDLCGGPPERAVPTATQASRTPGMMGTVKAFKSSSATARQRSISCAKIAGRAHPESAGDMEAMSPVPSGRIISP